MVIEAQVKNVVIDELVIADVISALEEYSKCKKRWLHPLLSAYINISSPLISAWASVEDTQTLTYEEFRQMIMKDVVDVWLTNGQPKFLKQLIMDHAVATADKLANIIFGGM